MTKKYIWIFHLIFVWAICVLNVGCQNQYDVPRDTVRIHIGAEPSTLNPIFSTDAYSSQVNGYIMDGLIKRNYDTFDWEPELATSWSVSKDKKVYTFHLRKDVKWHDGTPFTADDILYSFKYIMAPDTKAPVLKVYYQQVEKYVKIDDYTIECHYKEVYFMGLEFCAGIPIVPKHFVEVYDDFESSPFSRHPIGTGPYKFKEWLTNTRIVLERNEDYWGAKPAIKEINFKIIADSAVALQILKKGELDVFSLTNIQWTKQTGDKKFNAMFYKLAYPSPGYSYIGWNNDHKIFGDPKVRRAMTHMVDREKINQKLNFGLGKVITGSFFPFGKQYNSSLTPIPFDVQVAKKLLKEAGWRDTNGDGLLDKDGVAFKFDYLYPSAAKSSENIGTILKEEFRKIGIEMSITRMEWAAFLDRINKRQFDSTVLGWGTPFEGDPYQVWHISQADQESSSNFITYRNQEASDLIERARVLFDEKKRNQLYWKFHEILQQDQPYTFLFNKPSLVVVSRRFDNVKVHKAGIKVIEWVPAQN